MRREQCERVAWMVIVCLAELVLATPQAVAYDNGVVPVNTPASARRLITHLVATHKDKLPNGPAWLAELDQIETALAQHTASAAEHKAAEASLAALIRRVALANPLLDNDKLVLVRRKQDEKGFGFVSLNSYVNDNIPRRPWDNEIVIVSNLRGTPEVTPLYRQPNEGIMRDIDLHFDGKRLLYSSINEHGNWGVFELDLDSKAVRELTPNDQRDVQFFDACYLPEDGFIVTASTAGMQGLPCENGGKPMANLYRVNTETKAVRQLTFEQDSDWHPSVMEDGKVLYLRWEYSDVPHYMSRILFSMNPDGRNQRAIWGSGSLFPTAYKNPRQIPGNPDLFIGVVGGHHAPSESGRLLVVDPRLGTRYPFRFDPVSKEWGPEDTHINIFPRVFPKEVTGCVQEIPGFGRDVVGNVYDNQGGDATYQFAYPYPLDENFFLVSMRQQRRGVFGVWLVDRFDNMVKLAELPDSHLFQPIPLIARETPPVQHDMTDPESDTGTMFITDIYAGHGLKNIPRGKATQLRLFAYHFGYNGSGGHESVGQESSWDVKRILGTVDVEKDGSVCFNVPANTPISIQVLDEDGAALQLMRSWTLCMPGESLSCVGCHEDSKEATPTDRKIAAQKPPQEITPWFGPPRPFGYETEIQPLLDAKCIACHNDDNKSARGLLSFEAHNTGDWRTDTSYAALNPYCRHPGPETELEILKPMEYHASTSELVQRLRKGHFGVELSREDWERLYTWIDLNLPYRGWWNNPPQEKRRLELATLYAGLDTNPEQEYRDSLLAASTQKRSEVIRVTPDEIDKLLAAARTGGAGDATKLPKWEFSREVAMRRQVSADAVNPHRLVVPLNEKESITLVRIPAGRFVMGQADGYPDEQPLNTVTIEKPFWMAMTETTNAQYGAFDPDHDTRYLKEDGKDHVVPGYIANHPRQPAARLSWQEATQFCKWLSEKTGKKVTLPTEAQWEWAARAGTATPFYYGDRDANFSTWANLADAGLRRTYTSWDGGSKVHRRRDYSGTFPLRDDRFTDNWFVVDYVAECWANPWELYDIIGNVSEWTQSDYKPYPYSETDGRNDGDITTKKVARGGSWCDRPRTASAAMRLAYETYQKVHNVGFRIIIEE
ncbi:MAG: SUMF1/EgtB/PvdO family nonheme iron enzyme [Thermoguttaceae bacterium]